MIQQSLWKNLPAEIQFYFESNAQILDLKRGDFAYKIGDEPRGIYFVKKGLIGLTITGATSGKEHLLRFFRQDQFFGHRALFSNEGYHGNTVALEPTIIKLIPQNIIFASLEKYPPMYKEIVQVLAKELRRCEDQHVMILENQILPRTAQALIYLKELHPEHQWTRQEIANFTASTVSTIIKAMAELEDMGLILQNGRAIQILDRDKLLKLQDTAS